MNYRQPNVVETVIWLVAAAIAMFMAVAATLLMVVIGATMLLARMAGEAVRSLFAGFTSDGAFHKHNSKEQGVRPVVVEGYVISRR
ncbi:hypothetical protein [Bremerella cremea]|uniref:hypothetical protein n=1 Tax=Bremerella cremea TaxID=1031537 RepID=UPI0031E9289F